MHVYTPPEYGASAFNCPLCNAYASQTWSSFNAIAYTYHLIEGIRGSQCSHCSQWAIWQKESLLFPASSTAPMPHVDLPEDCKQDYMEARTVLQNSPRSSCALLRLCIQKLMKEVGESGENINSDIKNLVKNGLHSKVQMALDVCRVVGNNAVHPGEIDFKDNANIALNIFDLVNFITEELISKPKHIDSLFNNLPSKSIEAIEKRDNI